ncbi:MAG: hypothetical protein MUC97_10670 [Bernardetiaceae bacterium]|jgi:hypothetical protein|nr:hypothetical protein [Bernardetiaceae bacterium]
MEDPLKTWANQHRAEFETATAPDHLWEKIHQGLPQAAPVPLRPAARKLHTVWRVAAVGLVLVVASALWWGNRPQPASHEQWLAQYPQLQQAEQQYDGVIKAKLQQVKQHHDQRLISELLGDIEALELEYQGLKNDLNDGANNSQVVAAMIENYRIRIMLLEEFLKEIDKEATDHEKVI